MFRWRTSSYTSDSFSSSKTWEVLRPRAPTQASAKHIWFSGATPKHAFHMWATNLNKLPTRSRLASWACCVCSTQVETDDHLMLTCSYADLNLDRNPLKDAYCGASIYGLVSAYPMEFCLNCYCSVHLENVGCTSFGLRYMATAKQHVTQPESGPCYGSLQRNQ